MGLIAGVAYLTWLHMVNDITIFATTRSAKAAFLLYVTPLAVGVVALISLIKPLIPNKNVDQDEMVLDPQQQPLLFEYIRRLCVYIGAPMPRKITVNCEPNAFAGFRRGIFSFLGSDMRLTIGLPLAGGMPLKNFTGVLAHEFGHFAQGAGLRLTYIIRLINFWFMRVVYERDGFDAKIESFRREGGLLTVFGMLCQLVIWISRRVLWVLMIVGHLVSCFMLRQMEFDADRYETRVAGSKAFEQTARRLQGLVVSNQIAMSDLERNVSENKLCEDMPRLVVAGLKRITPEIRKKIDVAISEEITGLFDTHPCDTERIKNAMSLEAEGVLNIKAPASVLFNNFSQVCKDASFVFYHLALGDNLPNYKIIPAGVFFNECVKDEEKFKTVRRYFQDGVDPALPYFPNFLEAPPEDNDHARLIIENRRDYILKEADGIRKLIVEYGKAMGRILTIRAIRDLRNAGIVPNDPSRFDLPGVEDRVMVPIENSVRQRMKEIEKENAAFRDALDQRLVAGLNIAWKRPGVSEQTSPWISCLSVLEGIMEKRRELSLLITTMDIMGSCYASNPTSMVAGRIQSLRMDIERCINDIQTTVLDAPYPFAGVGDQPMLIHHILKSPPPFTSIDACLSSCNNMLERLSNVYFQCLAMLTQTAEKAELALGFQPLPKPPEPPKEEQEEE